MKDKKNEGNEEDKGLMSRRLTLYLSRYAVSCSRACCS